MSVYYDESSQPVASEDFNWDEIDGGLREPLEVKFQAPPKLQANYEFARRISAWMGGAKALNGKLSRALALEVGLGSNELSNASLRAIARKFGLDESNFRKEIVRFKQFMAGMEIYHLRGENEDETDDLSIRENELDERIKNTCRIDAKAEANARRAMERSFAERAIRNGEIKNLDAANAEIEEQDNDGNDEIQQYAE